MTAVALSVNKVASFPDGGGHFWVYLQYALGLRQLGCEVYWLEQLRPVRDPHRRAYVIATFQDRMKQFGFEGRTLLYDIVEGEPRFVACARREAEAVLRRADVLLNFHYAIDPRLLACARPTALVDIDPDPLGVRHATPLPVELPDVTHGGVTSHGRTDGPGEREHIREHTRVAVHVVVRIDVRRGRSGQVEEPR